MPPLAAAIVQSLATAIVLGEYPPGTALPSAGELCEEYEASRTVIREATTTLAEKRLVATRQGWGPVVLGQDRWSLLDPLVLDALFQREDRLVHLDNLIEIRTTLECAMAARAAGRIDEEQSAALSAKLDELAGLIDDPEAYSRADIELTHEAHARVAAAVLAGDGDAAAEAMREHITSSWARRRPAEVPDA
ncbi:FadR/GntR family transcriptional regulator [Streptomyces sp. NPDC018026]|uniref:FadR/GntR family transcriptional regulator n=1 Tax=Streptomyces sp. NPDC018026 TaxID=3365031 RepID=UPI00379D85CE